MSTERIFLIFYFSILFFAKNSFSVTKKPETSDDAYLLQKKYENDKEILEKKTKSLSEQDQKITQLEIQIKGLRGQAQDEKVEELKKEIEWINKSVEEEKKDIALRRNNLKETQTILADENVQKLLKDYVKNLSNLIAPDFKKSAPFAQIIAQSPIEKSRFTIIKTRINIFINENKARFFALMGNKEAVTKIRNTLDVLYQDLSKEGLFARAKNYSKLAPYIADLQERFKLYLKTLSLYQQLLEENAASTKDQQDIVENMKSAFLESLEVKKLAQKQFLAKNKKLIDQHVNDFLKILIPDLSVRQELQKKAGIEIVPIFDAQEIATKKSMLQTNKESVKKLIQEDLGSFFKNELVKIFFDDLMLLSQADTSKLSAQDIMTMRQDLRQIYAEVGQVLRDMFAKKMSEEEQIELSLQYAKILNNGMEQEDKFNDAFNNYFLARALHVDVENILTKQILEQYKKELENAKKNLVDAIKNEKGLLAAYKQLIGKVAQYNQKLDESPISQESLQFRVFILKDVLLSLSNQMIHPPKNSVSSRVLSQVYVGLVNFAYRTAQQLEVDEAFLIKKDNFKEKSQLYVVDQSARDEGLTFEGNGELSSTNQTLLAQQLRGVRLKPVKQEAMAPQIDQLQTSLQKVLDQRKNIIDQQLDETYDSTEWEE